MIVFRPAPDVVWVDGTSMPGIAATEVIWACRADDPHPVELRDWAWLIWRQALSGGTCDEIAARVSQEQELPEDGSVDVSAFLVQLAERGLLIASNVPSDAAEHPTG